MKYLETEHERKSFVISSTIMALILLLCIFFGLTSMDPPPENGIAINFGNTDAGSGNTNTTEPVKSEPREVTEQQPVEETSEPATPSQASENVITADNEAAIALKKQKEEANKKAVAEAKTKAAEQKKKKEEADKKAKLDALIGGVKSSDGKTTGGDGTSTTPGNQGKLDGSIYSNSFYGKGNEVGKGETGWGLKGRKILSPGSVITDCDAEGTVVVQVTVNNVGTVTKATWSALGSNTQKTCLVNAALQSAKKYRWNSDEKAPDTQIGFIVFNFRNGEVSQ